MNFMVITGSAKKLEEQCREMRELSEKGGGIIYQGRRGEDKTITVKKIIVPSGYPNVLADRLKIEDLDPAPSAAEYRRYYGKEPEGFNWGYPGGGAAQLAIALILDATGNIMLAVKYHQLFVERFANNWGYTWRIHSEHIKRFVLLKEEYAKNGGG